MKYQIPLIALAVFCMSILIAQNNIDKVYALTIETVSFGAVPQSSSVGKVNCEYISATEVWCPSSTGIKIWNPTSRSVTATLKPTGVFDDIKCTSSVCYAWEVSTVTGNLTRWIVSSRTLDDFQPFIGNAGFQTGTGIALVSGGDNTLVLPVEGQTCTDGVTPLGANDDKGVCLWSGGSGLSFDGVRWISAQTTNDLARIDDIEWNEGSGLFGNRVVAQYRDLAGVLTWQLLNMADGDTTFATNRICQTGSLTGLGAQNKIAIINGIAYTSYSASDMLVMDSTLDTCAVAVKTNLVDESSVMTVTYSSADDYFIVSASDTDGGNENSALYVFNGTTFDTITTTWEKVLKVNTTDTTNVLATHFNHPSEGEIHAWRGSQMIIVSELLTPQFEGGETTTICFITEGTNQQICVEYEVDENGNLIIDSPIGGVNPRNITDTTGQFFCAIGLTDCDNPDIQTNGVGMFMLLLLLLVSYALVVYIHHVAKQSVMGIHPMLVLLIGVIDVTIAFFLGWIPDYIFYTVIVLLIGLGGFGLYKIIRGM